MLRRSTNFGKWALAIKSGRYERLQFFLDEELHLGRLEYPDERPEPRIVLFLRLCRKTHDQPVINGAIDDQGRLRITARADQIGNVDKSKRHIVERTIGLRGVKLDDVEVFWVIDDVEFADGKALPRRQLDQPCPLQENQSACAVERLVGNSNAVSGFDLVETLDLVGEQSDRCDHADLVDLDQLKPPLLVLEREISSMLKQVRIDVFANDGFVQSDPIGHLDELDVDPFGLGEACCKLHELTDRSGAGRDLERFVSTGRCRERE